MKYLNATKNLFSGSEGSPVEAEMYVLCLLKFEDDEIVFTDIQQDAIKGCIYKNFFKNNQLDSFEPKLGFKVYSLPPERVECALKRIGQQIGEIICITSCKIGYYHHRAIVCFTFSCLDESYIRDVRNDFKILADQIIEFNIKSSFEQLISIGSIPKEGRCEFFYTYPLIIVHRGKTFLKNIIELFKIAKYGSKARQCPFSEKLTTLSYDFIEPSFSSLSSKRHMIRISIPSTIIYTNHKMDNDLLWDLINSIYQNCLYGIKLNSEKEKNVMSEDLLIKFSNHILESINSKRTELYLTKIKMLSFVVALIGVSIGVISFLYNSI